MADGQPVGSLISHVMLGQQLPRNISFPQAIPADMLAEYGFAPAPAMLPLLTRSTTSMRIVPFDLL
ncbi:hypothetical protein [Cupriavidus basilensis]